MVAASPASKFESQIVPFGLLLYLLLAIFFARANDGTYDSGDSIMHFQIARWAFVHPENFFSHWGKPFFTLIASLFCQLGFLGIKVLQCLLVTGIAGLSWKAAQRMQLRWAWLAPLLIVATPELFLMQLSGLTEPMFAFVLLLGITLFLYERPVWAAIVLSFLPYVRTEGYLIAPTIALYLLLNRQSAKLPFLFLGTVLYMLLGGLVKGDFLWLWTEMPYANGDLYYGKGGWAHFPLQYLYVVGIPVYILTILGLITLPMRLIGKPSVHNPALILLILGPFATYFLAHMYFWASGVGHSMGLIRVLVAVVPLGGLLALSGLNYSLEKLKHWPWVWKSLLGLIVSYLLLFPISPNPAAIHSADLQATTDQQLLMEAAAYLQDNGLAHQKLFAAHPAAAFYAHKDPFDSQQFANLIELRQASPQAGDLILVDGWFAKEEAGYAFGHFELRPEEYRPLKTWEGQQGDKAIKIELFQRL